MHFNDDLIKILLSAKESDEYVNPHLLTIILDGMEVTIPVLDPDVIESLRKWVYDMYSR